MMRVQEWCGREGGSVPLLAFPLIRDPPFFDPSVQVTLLASAVAFSLGSVTGLNSVRWFSAYATLNTIMIMLLFVSTIIGERSLHAGAQSRGGK